MTDAPKTPEALPPRMRRYDDWPTYLLFLRDCRDAAASDVLVPPAVAAALLGYSRVRMAKLIDDQAVDSWAWYAPASFHASEILVSVRSLILFGLRRGRLSAYETEIPLQSIIDRDSYEEIRQEIAA